MAENQQASNKRGTSFPRFLSSLFSNLLSKKHTQTRTRTHSSTHSWEHSGSSKNQRAPLQLAKPIYTDGGKRHHFCVGRGGGEEGAGLADLTEVAYELKKRWKFWTLGSGHYTTGTSMHLPFHTSAALQKCSDLSKHNIQRGFAYRTLLIGWDFWE